MNGNFWNMKNLLELPHKQMIVVIEYRGNRVDVHLCNRTARPTGAVNCRSFGVHHGRIYANVGSFISQNILHCTPLTVKHTFNRYLSLTEHKNWSAPIVWNECPFFFSVSYTDEHLCGFTETIIVIILAVYGAALSRSKDILFPYLLMCFQTLYLITLILFSAFTSTSHCS